MNLSTLPPCASINARTSSVYPDSIRSTSSGFSNEGGFRCLHKTFVKGHSLLGAAGPGP
jgi:hypothetical protein